MESCNNSSLFDTVIEKQAVLLSSFNESGILNTTDQNQDPNSCSTPCAVERTTGSYGKRRGGLFTEMVKNKLAKLDDVMLSNQKLLPEEDDHSIETSSSSSEQDTIVEKTCVDFITLDGTGNYNCIDEASHTIIGSTTPMKEKSFEEDEMLLLSSSDEEGDNDIESFYHLLDSPKKCVDEEDNYVLLNADVSSIPVIRVQVPSKVVIPESEKNGANVDADCVNNNKNHNEDVDNLVVQGDDNIAVLKAQENDKSSVENEHPNMNRLILLKNILPRSRVLKTYLHRFKNNQQQVYPKFLEEYKKMFSGPKLIELMSTIYMPAPGYATCNSLTVENYRDALTFCDKNPNLLKDENGTGFNFYDTPLHCSTKRFTTS